MDLDDLLPRFGRAERFLYWWLTAMLATALVTGLSGQPVAIHAGAVLLTGVGLVVAAMVGDRRAVLRSARTLFTLDGWDVEWLRTRLRHPRARNAHREWTMFSPGQKLFAWALLASVAVVIITVDR